MASYYIMCCPHFAWHLVYYLGQIAPPFIFLLWYKSKTFDTFLESTWAIFIAKSSYLAKNVRKNAHKLQQIIHFNTFLKYITSNFSKIVVYLTVVYFTF